MRTLFRATTPADAPAIGEFLGHVFGDAHSPILDPRLMAWKYWRERPGWAGSRSFVLEHDGSIVAHGAAWPGTLVPGEGIPCFQLIDWAASRESPGAGASIVRHMLRIVPVALVVSGTDIARKMHFAMGFRPRNQVRSVALPLRPIRQIMTSGKNWKTPARLTRNLLWSFRRPRPAAAWSAQPVQPTQLTAWRIPLSPDQPGALAFERTPEVFQYLSECPDARFRFFLSTRDSEPAGYFCIVRVPGQARIADAFVNSNRWQDWMQVYALAVEEAMRDPTINEIAAFAPDPLSLAALEACGFQVRGQNAASLLDPGKRVPAGLALQVQMIDGDAAFLSSSAPGYLT